MAGLTALTWRRLGGRPRLFATFFPVARISSSSSSATTLVKSEEPETEERGRWLALPPFSPPIEPSLVAMEIVGHPPVENREVFTALKWVRRCRPDLPVSLVHKLFRLRQVRKQVILKKSATREIKAAEKQLIRVSEKGAISLGDVILIPSTVMRFTNRTCECFPSEEINFIRGLELYEDSAIIVVNKPSGLPVQGGVGIKYSIDMLAAAFLKYDYSEPPRLVHRLDRDCSGVLVMGRTQSSTAILHSIFRERTLGAHSNDLKIKHRPLQRKYWALVIGTPESANGFISAPLAKIVLEKGKSERITVVNDAKFSSACHALTEYKVIRSSIQGYTWLELSPLTGRKHQLRVHCAEVLGTPILGDYKYGWQAHKKWQPVSSSKTKSECRHIPKRRLPFGLELEGGSVLEKQPRLHLHCRQMVLPDISAALQQLNSTSPNYNLSKLKKIELAAPLPSHMQMSWKILDFQH